MTPAPDAEHLLGGADIPQEEPGDCTNIGEVRGPWWQKRGWCHGCKSWQPAKLTPFGWRLEEHDPAPPRYHADRRNHPYPYPSYTQPDCDECAAQTNADSIARGDSVGGWEW